MDFDIILLGLQYIEFFKKLSGWGNDRFLSYMNDNDIWNYFMNDKDLILGMISSDIADIVAIIGEGLSICEQDDIICKNTV